MAEQARPCWSRPPPAASPRARSPSGAAPATAWKSWTAWPKARTWWCPRTSSSMPKATSRRRWRDSGRRPVTRTTATHRPPGIHTPDTRCRLKIRTGSTDMLGRIIEWSVRNVVLVLVMTVAVIAAGVYAVMNTPLDAQPDLSDVQVIVYTDVPGQAPQVV